MKSIDLLRHKCQVSIEKEPLDATDMEKGYSIAMVHIITLIDDVYSGMYKKETEITENTSDGYHTFKELYDFRKAYNVALFNQWGSILVDFKLKYDVHKSWKHNDGELCFGGGWFIVVAVLPTGQISNHYPASDWELFRIPEVEKAKYPFDGHTGKDVIDRLLKIKYII